MAGGHVQGSRVVGQAPAIPAVGLGQPDEFRNETRRALAVVDGAPGFRERLAQQIQRLDQQALHPRFHAVLP